MSKIIKLSFLLGFLLSVSTANASLVCPPTVTCNWDEGTCDQPDEWHIDGQFMQKAFPNALELGFINTSKMLFPDDLYGKYKIWCAYYPNASRQDSSPSIYLYAFANTFTGDNWIFSGFGKYNATCPDISDPTKCAAN